MANLPPQPQSLQGQMYGPPKKAAPAAKPVASRNTAARPPKAPSKSPIESIISTPVPGLAQPGHVLPQPKAAPKKAVVTPPHQLATPPPPKAAAPVVTHPHTIKVTPTPVTPGAGTVSTSTATSTPTSTPTAPTLPANAGNGYYTTKAEAQAGLPPDVPGSVVKFTKGKGYYIGDNASGRTTQSTAKAGATAAPSMADQINAALKAELDPQTAAINSGYQQVLAQLKSEQAKAQADAAAQAQTNQGFYGALAPLMAGVAPAVQGGYQDAANSLAGLAKGFSGTLGDVASADAARSQQLLGENGGQAQAAGAAQAAGTGGGAGNALFGTGGLIPSAELGAQGAAAGAAARLLPATYAGIGAQNASQALGVGAKNAQDVQTLISQAALKHSGDLGTLAAGVPKLRNDITAQMQDLSLKQKQIEFNNIIATGVDPITHELTPDARAKIAAITGTDPTTGQQTLAAAKASASETRAQAALDLNTVRTLGTLTGVVHNADGTVATDANGKPMLTPAGRRAAVAEYKATHTASKGGFTKAQVTKISTQAETKAQTQFNGVQNKDGTWKTYPVADYQQALKEQMAAGVPLQIAQRALNAFWAAGEHGRPYVPVQARTALEQAGLTMTDPLARPDQAQAAWLHQHGWSYAQ